MDGLFELTRQYALDRYAFGRPIGSFQASSFSWPIADVLEAARAVAASAVEAVEAGRDDAGEVGASRRRGPGTWARRWRRAAGRSSAAFRRPGSTTPSVSARITMDGLLTAGPSGTASVSAGLTRCRRRNDDRHHRPVGDPAGNPDPARVPGPGPRLADRQPGTQDRRSDHRGNRAPSHYEYRCKRPCSARSTRLGTRASPGPPSTADKASRPSTSWSSRRRPGTTRCPAPVVHLVQRDLQLQRADDAGARPAGVLRWFVPQVLAGRSTPASSSPSPRAGRTWPVRTRARDGDTGS